MHFYIDLTLNRFVATHIAQYRLYNWFIALTYTYPFYTSSSTINYAGKSNLTTNLQYTEVCLAFNTHRYCVSSFFKELFPLCICSLAEQLSRSCTYPGVATLGNILATCTHTRYESLCHSYIFLYSQVVIYIIIITLSYRKCPGSI